MNSDILPLLLIAGAVVVALWIVVELYFLIPRRMARKRHRDPAPWIILCFVASPLLVYLILLVAGDSHDQ